MKRYSRLFSFIFAAMLPLACTTTDPARVATVSSGQTPGTYPERIDESGLPVLMGPEQRSGIRGRAPFDGEIRQANGPFPVYLNDVPTLKRPDWVSTLVGSANKRAHAPGPVSEEEMAALRERARGLRGNPNMPQTAQANIGDVSAGAPASATGFAALDSGDCCGGNGVIVPPDPEMAAGPNHVIVAVNSAFAIYNKSGGIVYGPVTFEDFFGQAECGNTFDPNVLYDQSTGQFFLGIVGNGSGADYCYAFSTSNDWANDPWLTYSVQVDFGGDFFDFPHAGVGTDAIYLGANMFANSFTGSRLLAIKKPTGNNAGSVVVSYGIGTDFTPQPMNVHGANFPATGERHYFIANDVTPSGQWSADDFAVWEWADPFNSAPYLTGSFSLNGKSPIDVGFPVDQPQRGNRRAAILDGGDWRIQDAEYSELGFIVLTQAVSCNPGGGTVNCVRWAEVEPSAVGTGQDPVLNVEMIFSDGEYRSYPDAAVNSCGQVAVGYTKTSSSMYPGVWAAVRDDVNLPMGAEVELIDGKTTYKSFQSWRQANRWGDYTGMTIDPDGETFWYLGEYAVNNGLSTNWGTYVASLTLATPCGGGTDLPVDALDDAFSLDVQGGTNPMLAENVLNDDIQGNLPTTVVSYTNPAGGNVVVDPNGDLTYTWNGSFTGTYTFDYTIEDSDQDSDTAMVAIEVSDSGSPDLLPEAIDDEFSLDIASQSSVGGNVLGNDDQGDEPATVAFGTPNNGGSLSGTTGAGDFTYTPAGDFIGDESFGYTLTDVDGDQSTANVTVTVTNSSNAPVIHVSELSGTSTAGSRGKWAVTVTTVVVNATNAPVAGVTVDGRWSSGANGGGSCVTGGDGSCEVSKNNLRGTSATFTVNNLTAAGATYDASANEVGFVTVAAP